jgi:iron complex outermembrane receptor protein
MKYQIAVNSIRIVFIITALVFYPLSITMAEEAEDKIDRKMTADTQDTFKIEDIVVRGQAVSKDLEATSATVLRNEDITNRIFITPLDILTLVPGISVIQYKQGGTAPNFIMRGFSGNSHGPNTAIFLDGIPLNEGDGYADTNIVNPDEIERVEIIKGPSSALYGNYASAGAVAYYTKKRVDHNHLKLSYGAHNTYEANFVGGFSTEKWDHVYSVQTYHTDGYQDNSDWDRQNAAARITHHFTDKLNLRLSLRGFNSDWDAPGYISKKQFDKDPTKAVSETNGGGKDRVEGRIDIDYQLTADSKILFNIWGYDQEFWRWYANDPAGLAPDAVVGNLRDFKRKVYGTGTSYNYIGLIGNRELNFIAGADYMIEDDDRERWRLLAGTGREKGPKFWDYNIDMETLSFYAQGNYQVIDPLFLILGARYDYFSGELKDYLDDSKTFSMEDQSIFSPKAGFLLTLLNNRLDLFANYGEGFGLLPGFSEQAAFRQDDWDPQERKQYETGLRIRPISGLELGVVGFRLETNKDFIYNSVTDEYDNVGSTTREGIEVTLDAYALNYGYLHADYGYTDATYDDYVTSSGGDLSGKTLRSVPENIFNIEIGYSPQKGMGGRVRYHYEDGYFLDDANLFESDSWDRLDAQISYRFGNSANYLLALDIVNVFDEKYADYTSGTTNQTFSPGLPFSAYLTFVIDF